MPRSALLALRRKEIPGGTGSARGRAARVTAGAKDKEGGEGAAAEEKL